MPLVGPTAGVGRVSIAEPLALEFLSSVALCPVPTTRPAEYYEQDKDTCLDELPPTAAKRLAI